MRRTVLRLNRNSVGLSFRIHLLYETIPDNTAVTSNASIKPVSGWYRIFTGIPPQSERVIIHGNGISPLEHNVLFFHASGNEDDWIIQTPRYCFEITLVSFPFWKIASSLRAVTWSPWHGFFVRRLHVRNWWCCWLLRQRMLSIQGLRGPFDVIRKS